MEVKKTPSVKQQLDDASSFAKTGNAQAAAQIYRAILTRFPKHSTARKALQRLQKKPAGGPSGLSQGDANYLLDLVNSGQFELAEQAAKQLAQMHPSEPFLFSILGVCQARLGKSTDAATNYKWALKLNPEFVEVYNNLGSLLVETGKPKEAVSYLRKAISKRPGYPEAHHNIGAAHMALGDRDMALQSFDRAVELDPKYANALNSRGSLLNKLGNYSAAIDDYKRALAITPNDADVLANYSYALSSNGQSNDALSMLEKAIKFNPQNIEANFRYGIQLNELGRTKDAIKAFKAVLELDPNHAEALRLITSVQKLDGADPIVVTMQQLLVRAQTQGMDRVHLGFGLGKIYEDLGQFKKSAEYLKVGNDTYRGMLEYSQEESKAQFDLLKSVFTPDFVSRFKGAGSDSITPIFIVGLMRSGTSLIEQIISSHSSVFGAGELMAASQHSQGIYDHLAETTKDEVTTFSQSYLESLTANSGSAARVTDKMPGNFQHIGLLKLAFPRAIFVNMVRDPRDTCFSIYKNFFDTTAHQYAYNLEELALWANRYKDLMGFWHDLFPGGVYDCTYEAMIADQEGETRKLLAHCDLPWEDQVLDFHKSKRAVRTASVNQVRQKIYKSSVKAWQNYEEDLHPLIDGLDPDLWNAYLG